MPTLALLRAAGLLLDEPMEEGATGDELAARRPLTPLEEVAQQLRKQSELLDRLTMVVDLPGAGRRLGQRDDAQHRRVAELGKANGSHLGHD